MQYTEAAGNSLAVKTNWLEPFIFTLSCMHLHITASILVKAGRYLTCTVVIFCPWKKFRTCTALQRKTH